MDISRSASKASARSAISATSSARPLHAGRAFHLPLYRFEDADALRLPAGCALVGVELLDEAVELPSFRHPLRAAYVLGPERGSLSPAVVQRCEFVVKIPTRFCVNVGVAGALVMYDRMISLGRFAERPVRAGGPAEGPAGRPAIQSHGPQKVRNRGERRLVARAARLATEPGGEEPGGKE